MEISIGHGVSGSGPKKGEPFNEAPLLSAMEKWISSKRSSGPSQQNAENDRRPVVRSFSRPLDGMVLPGCSVSYGVSHRLGPALLGLGDQEVGARERILRCWKSYKSVP